jgi:hypothetical protein
MLDPDPYQMNRYGSQILLFSRFQLFKIIFSKKTGTKNIFPSHSLYLVLLLLVLLLLNLVETKDLGPRHRLQDLLFAVASALQREHGLRRPASVLLVQQLGIRRPVCWAVTTLFGKLPTIEKTRGAID